MKLFFIWQTENTDYDTYDSAVVCAKSEDDARMMSPSSRAGVIHNFNTYSDWATKPENVNVKYIGEADESIAIGVVCSSFNAG
jgi:hypothetical protein